LRATRQTTTSAGNDGRGLSAAELLGGRASPPRPRGRTDDHEPRHQLYV